MGNNLFDNTTFCFLLEISKTGLRGGGGNQAYSRLSITHGNITDCKLDSVVFAGVQAGWVGVLWGWGVRHGRDICCC